MCLKVGSSKSSPAPDSHGEHRNPGLPGRVGGAAGVPAFVGRAVGEQDNGLYAVGRPRLQHLNGTVQSFADGRAVGGLKAPQNSQAQVPVFGKGNVQTDEVVEGHEGGGVTRLDLFQEGPGRRLGGLDPGGLVVAVLHAAGTVQNQDRFQGPAWAPALIGPAIIRNTRIAARMSRIRPLPQGSRTACVRSGPSPLLLTDRPTKNGRLWGREKTTHEGSAWPKDGFRRQSRKRPA